MADAHVELQQIGPYPLTRLLKVASTSSLYQGKQTQRKKDIVIRIFHTPLATNEVKEAFLSHAKQLKKLKHRHIIEVHDFGFTQPPDKQEDYGYLVMQYVDGTTLRQRFAVGQQIAPDEVKRILSPIASALHYAHISNVVHGNLHPGNLLAGANNDILLADFSLPLLQEGTHLDDEASLFGRDKSGPYKAPEQLQGVPTAASDQYALAIMAYEWLCGRRPYSATDRQTLLQQQEHDPLPLPGSFNRAISLAVEEVLFRALAYVPGERFQHTQAFADNYLRALMGLPTDVERRRTTPKRPKLSVDIDKKAEDGNTLNGGTAHSTQSIVPSSSIPMALGDNGNTSIDTVSPTPDIDDDNSATIDTREDVPPPTIEPISNGASRLHEIVTADLCQGGILSESLGGYEERPAQIEMAQVVARSLMERTPAIIEAGTGTGKALDVDTPIATPNGWKRMGDLVAGDFVFDENGHPTCVMAAFDVMYGHTCYEVVFSDGSSIVADAEHEWASYTTLARDLSEQRRDSRAYTLITTERMAATLTVGSSARANHAMAVAGPLVLPDADLPIEPYFLGVWLGDSSSYGNQITIADPTRIPFSRGGFWQDCRGRVGAGVGFLRGGFLAGPSRTRRGGSGDVRSGGPCGRPWWGVSSCLTVGHPTTDNSDMCESQYISVSSCPTVGHPTTGGHKGPLPTPLYTCPPDRMPPPYAITRAFSNPCVGKYLPKHIPAVYLRASEQQRRALLAGLLNTDGTVNRDGATEFTTTSPRLAEDVYELMCSLGLRPSRRCGRARCNGKDRGPKWTFAFTTDEQVFRLERKVTAHKERLRNYSPKRNRFRYVVAVREVPSRPVRCISVESQSHLYLAGRSMIPTHNSLAYLVPIVRSGKVAIISTANKALQEQLFYKDIPFVQKHIKHFEAALVKGVGNYVCLDRLENERVGIQFYAKNRDFTRLLDITQDPDAAFMGDFETLGFQLSGDIRSKVCADSDQCAWTKCDYFADCYVREMRERAERAQVIVVNHTLLLLDAAMDGFLLPDRDVIVLDEAHHLEEEATRSFTITISANSITTLLAQRLLKDHSQLSLQDEANRALMNTWLHLEQVADPGFKGRANLQAPVEEGLKLATVISDLAESLRKQRPKDLPDKESQLYDKLLKRTQNLSQNIRIVFSVDSPGKFVYYVERVTTPGQRGFHLQVSAAPLDITTWLKERLFDKCNVICTSATLATLGPNLARPEDKGPNFAYFRRRVGLDPSERPDVMERILPLAFDYESNALLYLPRDLPAPVYGAGSDDYTKAIAREMYRLVKASRGRAFLLFSSKRMLEQAYELMSPHLDFPLLKQGDMPRIELTRQFREEKGAILFGLKSFWEGVDIAGEALSLVVIDKLPFDPPDDPVHEARVAQMKAAGENWFGIYVLPQAVLRLKQGLGRLLRTREDRGVMAILDTRLHTKGYGRLVLDALPPARRTASIKEVDRFFAE